MQHLYIATTVWVSRFKDYPLSKFQVCNTVCHLFDSYCYHAVLLDSRTHSPYITETLYPLTGMS